MTKDAAFLFDILSHVNVRSDTIDVLLVQLPFPWILLAAMIMCSRRACGLRQLVIDDATELLASEAAVAGRKSVCF